MALTREDWVRAALLAVAEGGTAAAAIEPLAARLGTTKGSFYWHFKNRSELIAAALALWEREATDRIIEELQGVEDPVERLELVLRAAMEDESDEDGAIDASLLATAGDPLVATPSAGSSANGSGSWRIASGYGRASGGVTPPSPGRLRRVPGLVSPAAGGGSEGLDARERAAYQRTALDVLTRAG